jgi:hypothetical protein
VLQDMCASYGEVSPFGVGYTYGFVRRRVDAFQLYKEPPEDGGAG